MKSIRVENIRSLVDTTLIDLKPITLLIGQNSSGKSSFLRMFPLLRQSVEAVKAGPILWFGRFVDFGDFDKTISVNRKNDEISIHMIFDINQRYYSRFLRYGEEFTEICIDIAIYKDKEKRSAHIRRLRMKIYDHEIEILLNSKLLSSVIINGVDFSEHYKKCILQYGLGIIPRIYEENSINKNRLGIFSQILMDLIKPLMHGRTKDETITSVINQLTFGSSGTILNSIKDNQYAPPTWKNHVNLWDESTERFIEIKNYVVAGSIINTINIINEYIRDMLSNVFYIAPVRASAQRYYRYQDLSVNEIDPLGGNLPILLNNLTRTEKEKFSNWIQNSFGFRIKINDDGNHISLFISENNSSHEYNLADTGFGFSQVLPILTQLWLITNKRYRSPINKGKTIIYAIEQPELHLHPTLQAKLADIFVEIINVANGLGIILTLLIETHSETMINRFGHTIAEKILDENNINVIVFEKKGELTNIRKSFYDSDGYLYNWPIGFFEPED